MLRVERVPEWLVPLSSFLVRLHELAALPAEVDGARERAVTPADADAQREHRAFERAVA